MLHHDTFKKLEAARPRLAANDHSFADSLLAAYPRWSDKQAHWAGKIAARPDQPAPLVERIVDDLQPILDAFASARKHLKQPGFRILMNGTAVLRITVATTRSRTPGDLFVAGDGGWGDRSYFGRIDMEGMFHPGRDAGWNEQAIRDALGAFSRDPVAAAKAYAKLFGKCCFCNTALTDGRSTDVGYGPVCAKRYGLPWSTTEVRVARAA